jgi:serine/threonine protein kinase
MASSPATVLAGRYILLEMVGEGGMGRVWRARDQTLHRDVAVKEVAAPRGLQSDALRQLYRRTFREARTAARLDHPGIVTVHDVVEQDGRPWIVMQYVPAPSLTAVLAERGPLPPHEVAAIGVQLLDALATAHAAGVLHRDVKPGNVLLAGSRTILTDFGIATRDGDTTITAAGAIVGSPAYLAPERARQQNATPATDLWSLGATLYTAVEGHPPYNSGDIWAMMAALLNDEPDPPHRAGPLTPVLAGLLHRDPQRRMTAAQARRSSNRSPRHRRPQVRTHHRRRSTRHSNRTSSPPSHTSRTSRTPAPPQPTRPAPHPSRHRPRRPPADGC